MLFKSKVNTVVEQLCDVLLKHQYESGIPAWEGGIVCPACKSIHGRSGDAIFPLYYMAVTTGDNQYKQAARRLVLYMSNRQLSDGSWLNDECSGWKGTTVFQLLSLSHAYDFLQKSGEIDEAKRLVPLIEKAVVWVDWAFCKGGIKKNNINYIVSAAAVLQWYAHLFGQQQYAIEANKLIEYSLTQINRDGFIIGESKFPHIAGDQIDIGYNMDMTIGALAEYAMLTGDQRVLAEAVRTLQAHIQMVYPDGSIDNSFGSRHYKWTMYGSKTAHGCQMAMMILAKEDATFAVAAERNVDFLTSCITEDGFVGYGPGHELIVKENCIHTTFNRADSLTVALVYGYWEQEANEKVVLPNDELFHYRHYRSLNTSHIRSRHWMGTISGYGSLNAPTGGTISYLWHNHFGALQLGAATVYKRTEIANMPEYPALLVEPITPRIEATIADKRVSNLYEHHPAITYSERAYDRHLVQVNGKLHMAPLGEQIDSQVFYTIDYEWTDKQIIKTYYIDVQTNVNELLILEPIVIHPNSEVTVTSGGIIITKHGERMVIIGSGEQFMQQKRDNDERIISLFPAVQCLPLSWKLMNVEKGIYTFTFTLTME